MDDPCVEENIWRLQTCRNCGWQGDVVSGEFILMGRQFLWWYKGESITQLKLRDYFERIGLCG